MIDELCARADAGDPIAAARLMRFSGGTFDVLRAVSKAVRKLEAEELGDPDQGEPG